MAPVLRLKRTIRPRTIRRLREREAKSGQQSIPTSDRSALVFGLLLVVGTLALYNQVRNHDFINYDDKDYVINNSHVTGGLTWETIRWSLTATEQANWHPLTWLSHALDCQLFGLDAGYHHITNLLLHVLNALLLLLLLQRATAALWRSFLVAAMFAWHPYNVQSVAWVAERKNLLCTLFFLLTLGAYGWYAKKPGWQRITVVGGLFVLALASKPMAVTLPFVLFLLDYWPLRRISGWTKASSRLANPQQTVWLLLLEKLPLIALSGMSCVVTVWAQRAGGALRSLQAFSFTTRVENALQSYGIYLWKTVLPFGFSLYYPFSQAAIPIWKPAGATAVLVAISTTVWKQRATRPYLIMGWLWFLGTLVPVIGVVQVGDQAMADRYTYLPLIGIFVAFVWIAFDWFDLHQVGNVRWVAPAGVLLAICFLTSQQLEYWHDSETIWTHALQTTHGDLLVEKQLANALVTLGETDKALPHLIHIAQVDPNDTTTHVNLGACYAAQERIDEATDEFEKVIQLTNHKELSLDDRKFRTSAFLNLGFAYSRSKDYPNALVNFQAASQFDSPMVDQMISDFERAVSTQPAESLYLRLSLLLQARGKDNEAISVLEEQIKLHPDSVESRALLNYLRVQPKLKVLVRPTGARVGTSRWNL